MKRTVQPLTLFLAICVGAYHAHNALHFRFFDVRFVPGKMRVIWQDSKLVEIPTWINVTETGVPIDHSSARLTHLARKFNPAEQAKWQPTHYSSPADRAGTISDSAGEKLIAELEELTERLRRCGVTLVLVPIPTRAQVDSPVAEGVPYTAVYRKLLQRKLVTIDLLTALRKQASQDLFLTNEHFTSLGTALSAEAIVKKLESLGEKPTNVAVQFENFEVQAAAMAPPGFFRSKKVEGPSNTLRYNLKSDSGEIKNRIIGIGTSFSGQYRENRLALGDLVAKATHRRLLDFSYAGAGLWGSIRGFVSSRFELDSGDIVIWEFPIIQMYDRKGDDPRSLNELEFFCSSDRKF